MARIKSRVTQRGTTCNKIFSDGSKPTTSVDLSLANALTQLGERYNVPGRKYSGTQRLMNYKDAEYLYLTNAYIARGVDAEAAAIVRNGIELVATKSVDKRQLDLILQHNDIEILINEIARNVAIYGVQFIELYDDPITGVVRFELIPTPEMDYLRDGQNNIIYDKDTGAPYGYVQTRVGPTEGVGTVKGAKPNEIARWEGKDAGRIVEFKYKTLGGCIEGIPNLQTTLYAAIEYGYIRASLADSFIRAMPVAHVTLENPSREDLEEAQSALMGRFNARTFLLTSDRYNINIKSPSNDIDIFKYIEPAVAEIAAAFHIPIEMLAPTQYTHADDFDERVKEWYEYIKVKQKIIASILEHKVFARIFKNPIKVRFNSPAPIGVSDLVKSVGFCVQSGAITQEMALDILQKAQVFGAHTIDVKSRQGSDTNADVQRIKPLQRADTQS